MGEQTLYFYDNNDADMFFQYDYRLNKTDLAIANEIYQKEAIETVLEWLEKHTNLTENRFK